MTRSIPVSASSRWMSQSKRWGSISSMAVWASAAEIAIRVSQEKLACSCRSIKRAMMISSSMINILIMCGQIIMRGLRSNRNGERIAQSLVLTYRHFPVHLAGKVPDQRDAHRKFLPVQVLRDAYPIIGVDKLEQMIVDRLGLYPDTGIGMVPEGVFEGVGQQLRQDQAERQGMFVAQPDTGGDILQDPGLFPGVIDLLQMCSELGCEFAEAHGIPVFGVEQFLVDEHHGPDLPDIAIQDVAGYTVFDHGQLEAQQAVEQLEIVFYPV